MSQADIDAINAHTDAKFKALSDQLGTFYGDTAHPASQVNLLSALNKLSGKADANATAISNVPQQTAAALPTADDLTRIVTTVLSQQPGVQLTPDQVATIAAQTAAAIGTKLPDYTGQVVLSAQPAATPPTAQ